MANLTEIPDFLRFAMAMDKVTEYISAFICLPGAIFNGLLIWLILRRTPPQMKSYAVYLLNFAVFDFATCILSFFSCQKVVFSGFSLIYVFHGPCKHISAWFCYFCHCFECHTLAHSQWILLGSFIYRMKVLEGESPTVKSMFCKSAFFYSMSLCFLIFYLFDISDSSELLRIMASLHPQYHYDDSNIWKNLVLSGNISMLSPITFISIMYMTFPCVPIYATILYCRRRTLMVLNNPELNLSPTTKASHKKLVTALTIQAGIPIFWLVASGIYTMAQFGLIQGPIPENITFRLMDCIPMVSPIVTIIFIQAYREGVVFIFQKVTGSNFLLPNFFSGSVVDVTRTDPTQENPQDYAVTQL